MAASSASAVLLRAAGVARQARSLHIRAPALAFIYKGDPFVKMYNPAAEQQKTVKLSEKDLLIVQVGRSPAGPIGSSIPQKGRSAETDSGGKHVLPHFQLLPEAEAIKLVQAASQLLDSKVESPVDARPLPDSVVLSKNPSLANKRIRMVFTDTSGGDDHTRTILVRETDGTLRTATPEERDRCNQTFFARPHTTLRLPALLEEKNLHVALKENMHVEVLNMLSRTTLPYRPDFGRVQRTVFDDVDERRVYSLLQSSKHWLGFANYLIREHKIVGLLTSLLDKSRLTDSVNLVKAYHLAHPTLASAKTGASNPTAGLLAFAESTKLQKLVQLATDVVQTAAAKERQQQKSDSPQQQQQQQQPRSKNPQQQQQQQRGGDRSQQGNAKGRY